MERTMIKLEPIVCSEIVRFYPLDFELSVLESFSKHQKKFLKCCSKGFIFNYERYCVRLGDGITETHNVDKALLSEGIKITKKQLDSFKKFQEHIVKEIVSMSPVVIVYRRNLNKCLHHYEKIALIIGIDNDKVCVRNTVLNRERWVETKKLYYQVNYVYNIQFFDNYKHDITYDRIFNELVEDINRTGYFAALDRLSYCLLKAKRENEINNKDYRAGKDPDFIKKIELISLNKAKYYLFLESWDQQNVKQNFSEEYKKILMQWCALNIMIKKAWDSGLQPCSLAKISLYLQQIAVLEQEHIDYVKENICSIKN